MIAETPQAAPQPHNPKTPAQNPGRRTDKPNSVVCDHSSRRCIAANAHQRPTRRLRHLLEPPVAYRTDTPRRLVPQASGTSLPIWSCSVWGLPCLRLHSRSGALLPHHFTLTPRPILISTGSGAPKRAHPFPGAVCFLWHLPSTRLPARIPDVIRHTVLWSSDFPLPAAQSPTHPAATA